jgi:glycosyltransferase involved in cell wall biosynthesis
VTIHDLAFIHFPAILDADARRFYGQVRAAAHDADAVITVSEATRADIVALLDLPPERVAVVYEAADPRFVPAPVPADETRLVGETPLRAGAFLLFMSTVEPRKNLETLLRALRVCRDRRPGVAYELAVAGARGWLDAPIFALARELALGDAVRFLGQVGPDDQLWLYNACRLYLNPSLYEGFGLPALEALACGAPSLVADSSSLPEVMGDAARLLPVRDVAAWADAIEALWHDDAARADLARSGPGRAAQFSWRRAAQETLSVYRRTLGAGYP